MLVVGFHFNRLDDEAILRCQNLLLTELGIHHILESCDASRLQRKDVKGLFVTTPVAMSVWLVKGSVAVAGLCPEPRPRTIPATRRIGSCRGW